MSHIPHQSILKCSASSLWKVFYLVVRKSDVSNKFSNKVKKDQTTNYKPITALSVLA